MAVYSLKLWGFTLLVAPWVLVLSQGLPDFQWGESLRFWPVAIVYGAAFSLPALFLFYAGALVIHSWLLAYKKERLFLSLWAFFLSIVLFGLLMSLSKGLSLGELFQMPMMYEYTGTLLVGTVLFRLPWQRVKAGAAE